MTRKLATSKTLLEKLSQLLQHFETYHFTQCHSTKYYWSHNSELLKRNIKHEWMLANTVTSDEPIFITQQLNNCEMLKKNFFSVKELVEKLPFSLVASTHVDRAKEKTVDSVSREMEVLQQKLPAAGSYTLKKQTFCSPTAALNLFHKYQRERKMWWRKFSALPGRVLLTEITSCEVERSQCVEIQAEFPWGCETVESIKYFPEILSPDFEVKENRKKFIPHVVSTETALDNATRVFLCDAYDGINDAHAPREVLRFHRKLAPFKVSFAASSSSTDVGEDLYDLALLLARQIRKTGTTALLLPELNKKSLEQQFTRNDAMGIPYTVVLNEKTLKDGLLGLRSRDTTLKEQCHVSTIASYMEKLMKNY